MYGETVDYDTFPSQLRKELDNVVVGDWEKVALQFDCVNSFSEVKIFPYNTAGELLSVQRSDKFVELLFELRNFSYASSGSAWYTTMIEFDKSKDEMVQSYNYEDEPDWKIPSFSDEQKDYMLNREYSAELEKFPREETPTPGWLINRAMNWNPNDTNPFNQNHDGIPNFDEPPNHEGHNHPQAPEIINALVGLCLHVQPTPETYGLWSSIKLRARAVGDLFEWDILGYDEDGEPIPLMHYAVAEEIEDTLKLLRLATYTKADGAWFTAEITLTNTDQSINIHFDYDAEPAWTFPKNDDGSLSSHFYEAYRTELQYFPRPYDRTPEWLSKHL